MRKKKLRFFYIFFIFPHKNGIKYFLKLFINKCLRALITKSLDHYPKTKNEVTNSFESVSCINFVILENNTHTHKMKAKKANSIGTN